MYPTYRDTQQSILNDKVIIQQVVVEWNRKSNKKVTKNKTSGEMQLWDVDNFKKTGQVVERYPQEKSGVRMFGLLIFILHR